MIPLTSGRNFVSRKRTLLGFALRFAAAILISLLIWWLFVTPFDRLPISCAADLFIGRALDFPVALAGELLYPIRGMELVFGDRFGTWCDFCQVEQMFWLQMRLSVPVYLLLLYIPTMLRWIARRDVRLPKRIVIGLLIYATFTAAFFLLTSGVDVSGDVLVAGKWFIILSAAGAFAWSNLSHRWKIVGVVAVILFGAWAFAFMMSFIAPKMDEVRPYYLSFVVLLTFGIGGMLWLTRVAELGISAWRRHVSKNRAEHPNAAA